MNSELLTAILAGTGTMLGWGLADFFAKKAIDKIGHTRTLFWMQTLAIFPLLVFLFVNRNIPTLSLSALLILIIFGITNTTGYLFFYKSLEKGKISILSPLVTSHAAFVVLISAFVFGESIPPLRWLTLGVIFIGMVLASIDFKEFKNSSSKLDLIQGLPEVSVAVAVFALWYPFWDRFVNEENWIFSIMTVRIVGSLILLGLASKNKLSLKIEKGNLWFWVLLMGLLDVGAYLSITWGYKATSMTSVITVLGAALPLPTLILARIFLKEKLAFNQWVGVGLIIGGIILLPITG